MRSTNWAVIALATAAAGCQLDGMGDGGDSDLRKHQTAVNWGFDVPVEGGKTARVVVEKIQNHFDATPPTVSLTLKNTGSPIEILTFEVEFGFPAPEESFAPYIPQFETEVVPDVFKTGESKSFQIRAGGGAEGKPIFTRVVPMSGSAVRQTTGREEDEYGRRRGSTMLSNRIEVVAVDADFTGPAPRLSFTLENIDAGGDQPMGDLSYTVQFFKGDKSIDTGSRRFRGFKGIGKPLGKRGERVTFDVEGLADLKPEVLAQLGGAKPVLTVRL